MNLLKAYGTFKISPNSLLKMAIYGLLLLGLYYRAILEMTRIWNLDQYNYAYLMPFVVFYLIWVTRARLLGRPTLPSWRGITILLFGISFFWLGELGGNYYSLYFSLWLVIVGLFWTNVGWQKMRVILFPLFMILTMFPLPYFIYANVSVKLQLISSNLGVNLLQAYGLPAYREGNVIYLAFTQLQVVEACSGLKTLISLVVLGLLVTYFFKGAFWKRTILILSVVPIAIFTNSTRIAVTGILYEAWGAKAAEGFFHGFSGIAIFMLSLCLLLLELWILKWLPPRENKNAIVREKREKRNVEMLSEHTAPQVSSSPSSGEVPSSKGNRDFFSFFSPPQFIVAALLLGVTFILSQGVDFREKIPIKKSFDRFPVDLDEWTGTPQILEQRYLDSLHLSDYTIIDYENRAGKQINLYVAYYESQGKGKSIHSPGACLPGSGWIFKKADSTTVPIPGYREGFIQANRAFMQKDGQERVVYYWYSQRGRNLASLYTLKIFTFLGALTKQRTDAALVRLITPVYESESVKDADERLQAFAPKIVPVISEFIPN